MRLKIILLLLLFGLGINQISIAQSDDSSKAPLRNNYNTRIQLGYGVATANGGGFSFRYTKEKHGFLATLSPFVTFDDGTFFSDFLGNTQVGLNYNYYFFKKPTVDFSLLVGGELRLLDLSETTSYVALGIAPQIDIHLGNFINLEIHLGFGAYNITGGNDEFSILPSIGGSLLHNLYY